MAISGILTLFADAEIGQRRAEGRPGYFEMSSRLEIRPAVAADAPLILAFVRELAAYEREPDAVVATEADFARDGFGPAPLFHTLIATWNGQPAGFAFYFLNYSTWRGRPVLYLEDLFVRPLFRQKRIGFSLMRALAAVALERGCARFQWQVLDWNEPRFAFMNRSGPGSCVEWLTVRIEGEALARLSVGDVTSF